MTENAGTFNKVKKKRSCSFQKIVPVHNYFPPPITCNVTSSQSTSVLSEKDFPVLGSKKNKVLRENKNSSEVIEVLPDDKSCRKALKLSKHGEAYSLNVNDLIHTSHQKTRRKKIRRVLNFKEELQLSGNALDSDNPVRKRGIVNSQPKVKPLSKTKAMVYEAREEMKKLKAIPANEEEVDMCDISFKNLNLLLIRKLKEIRKCIQEGKMNVYNVGSSQHFIPLQEALEKSKIPPYKFLVHSNNFKMYCDNCLTLELNQITEKLISQLVRFQYNKYQQDPWKAVAKKRYVLGLKQVKKYTKLHKIKIIIFAPNLEDILYDTVEELKSLAGAYCIPYLFAFNRKKLGNIAYKKTNVSCVGILDYSGADDYFKKCLEMLSTAKTLYHERCFLAQNSCKHFSNSVSTKVISDLDQMTSEFIEKLSLENSDLNHDTD